MDAKDHLERLHLSFLKWTIGVHKKTSNTAVWGDCGRYPLGIVLLKQVFEYQERLVRLDLQNSDCLVRHAYKEQANLNLDWYDNLTTLRSFIEKRKISNTVTPGLIKSECQSLFLEFWNYERLNNKKLSLYNEVKQNFEIEPYLQQKLTYKQSKCVARLRSSSHRLNCETGRHGVNRADPLKRLCDICNTSDKETLRNLTELPMADPIIEDELHVLRCCPNYHDIRIGLSHSTKTDLFADISNLFGPSAIQETAKFITKIFNRRFPPKETATKGLTGESAAKK
jgi:hypothetical protein